MLVIGNAYMLFRLAANARCITFWCMQLAELQAQVAKKSHENDELRQQLMVATQSPVQDQEVGFVATP